MQMAYWRLPSVSGRVRRAVRVIPVVVALLLLAAQCGPTGFSVGNRTSERIDVEIVGDDPRRIVVGPGSSNGFATGRGGCLEGELVAYDLAGNEIARLDRPACEGQAWVIEEGGTSFR
jgi:hypothetical protein